MHEHLKYVTARPSIADPKRWYWQRPGFPLQTLPADPVRRLEMVNALNAAADGKVATAAGSVAWVIQAYKDSDEYKALKKGSLKYYNRFLKDLELKFGPLSFRGAMTRRVVVDYVKSWKAGLRRQVGAVLVNVFNAALYHQYADQNHAHKLKIKGGARRETVFSADDIKAWLGKCDDAAMQLAFTILRFAVQRPNDVLMMTWAQYNGDTIKLRQEKTGKLIEVPCHSELRMALDDAKKSAKSVYIVSSGYRRLPYSSFCSRFRVIADAAELPGHQARDLRRTAAVRMSEAEATIQQIAAIAGWSIQYTQHILETYIPRTLAMGRGAIAKWEQNAPKV